MQNHSELKELIQNYKNTLEEYRTHLDEEYGDDSSEKENKLDIINKQLLSLNKIEESLKNSKLHIKFDNPVDYDESLFDLSYRIVYSFFVRLFLLTKSKVEHLHLSGNGWFYLDILQYLDKNTAICTFKIDQWPQAVNILLTNGFLNKVIFSERLYLIEFNSYRFEWPYDENFNPTAIAEYLKNNLSSNRSLVIDISWARYGSVHGTASYRVLEEKKEKIFVFDMYQEVRYEKNIFDDIQDFTRLRPALSLEKIKEDGNCLYEAVARSLEKSQNRETPAIPAQNEEKTSENNELQKKVYENREEKSELNQEVNLEAGTAGETLRESVVNRLNQNYEKHASKAGWGSRSRFRNYIHATKEGAFGGYLELAILMQYLDRPILVINPQGNRINNLNDVERYTDDPVFIYLNERGYYHAVKIALSMSGREVLDRWKSIKNHSKIPIHKKNRITFIKQNDTFRIDYDWHKVRFKPNQDYEIILSKQHEFYLPIILQGLFSNNLGEMTLSNIDKIIETLEENYSLSEQLIVNIKKQKADISNAIKHIHYSNLRTSLFEHDDGNKFDYKFIDIRNNNELFSVVIENNCSFNPYGFFIIDSLS